MCDGTTGCRVPGHVGLQEVGGAQVPVHIRLSPMETLQAFVRGNAQRPDFELDLAAIEKRRGVAAPAEVLALITRLRDAERTIVEMSREQYAQPEQPQPTFTPYVPPSARPTEEMPQQSWEPINWGPKTP